jgi:hypothetical protein
MVKKMPVPEAPNYRKSQQHPVPPGLRNRANGPVSYNTPCQGFQHTLSTAPGFRFMHTSASLHMKFASTDFLV